MRIIMRFKCDTRWIPQMIPQFSPSVYLEQAQETTQTAENFKALSPAPKDGVGPD